jgi:hypothetical protein
MPEVSHTNKLELMIDMPTEMVDCLNELARRARDGGRSEIGISEIVTSAVRTFIMESGIDISGVENEEEIIRRIKSGRMPN